MTASTRIYYTYIFLNGLFIYCGGSHAFDSLNMSAAAAAAFFFALWYFQSFIGSAQCSVFKNVICGFRIFNRSHGHGLFINSNWPTERGGWVKRGKKSTIRLTKQMKLNDIASWWYNWSMGYLLGDFVHNNFHKIRLFVLKNKYFSAHFVDIESITMYSLPNRRHVDACFLLLYISPSPNKQREKYVFSLTNCGQFDDTRSFFLWIAKRNETREKKIESFSIHKSMNSMDSVNSTRLSMTWHAFNYNNLGKSIVIINLKAINHSLIAPPPPTPSLTLFWVIISCYGWFGLVRFRTQWLAKSRSHWIIMG